MAPYVQALNDLSDFEYKNSGPGEHANYLKQLRQALDAGTIDAATFLKKGLPVAQEGFQLAHQLGSQGSGSASNAAAIRNVFTQAGFKEQGSGDSYKVLPKLPAQYQEQIRESLLPPGLTPEQKNAYLKDIPQDIEFGSDQYNLEKEGLRQKLQQEGVASEQSTKRKALLDDLTGVLNTQVKNQFDRSVSDIAENANTAGIFRSTGFGNALAKQQAQLSQDAASELGKKAIEYGETDVNAVGDILSNVQGYQGAGLSRKFSLDDFEKQAKMARELADAATPKPKGKTNGEKWAQGAQTGAAVIQAGAAAKKGK